MHAVWYMYPWPATDQLRRVYTHTPFPRPDLEEAGTMVSAAACVTWYEQNTSSVQLDKCTCTDAGSLILPYLEQIFERDIVNLTHEIGIPRAEIAPVYSEWMARLQYVLGTDLPPSAPPPLPLPLSPSVGVSVLPFLPRALSIWLPLSVCLTAPYHSCHIVIALSPASVLSRPPSPSSLKEKPSTRKLERMNAATHRKVPLCEGAPLFMSQLCIRLFSEFLECKLFPACAFLETLVARKYLLTYLPIRSADT
eukprot:4552309-Pleurochrysis_carterae.AAC.1